MSSASTHGRRRRPAGEGAEWVLPKPRPLPMPMGRDVAVLCRHESGV